MNVDLKFKLKKLKYECMEISNDYNIMLKDITNVNKTYDRLMFKNHPQGHSMNAIKFLKSPNEK